MATHPSVLAWRIPGTGEPGGLPSLGSHRVGLTEVTQQQQQQKNRSMRFYSLSINNSWTPPKPMSIESVMPSNHLILCHPLLLPSIFPSIMVFSNESALPIRQPKYLSFNFNISPSNEHPGLISFRMNWLDLLVVQETLKSLLQHHTSKASIFLALSLLYGPTLTSIHTSMSIHTTGQTMVLTV